MEYIDRGSYAKPLVVGLTMPSQEVGTARNTKYYNINNTR